MARTVCVASAMAFPYGSGARGRCGLLHLDGVSLEGAGGRELTQFVANHIFGEVDRNEFLAVVHGDGVADELGQHGRAPRPGLVHLLLVAPVHLGNTALETAIDERSLFYRSR